MRHEPIHMPSSGLAAAWAGLRAILATVMGLVLMLSAMAVGVVLGVVVLLWKLLGGRHGRIGHFASRGARATPRSRPTTPHDVIDVEAREVAMRETPHR